MTGGQIVPYGRGMKLDQHKWAIINDLAEKEGVPKDTRRKWRIRGVPTAWQIKLVKTSPHLSFDDFEPVETPSSAVSA